MNTTAVEYTIDLKINEVALFLKSSPGNIFSIIFVVGFHCVSKLLFIYTSLLTFGYFIGRTNSALSP